MLFRSTDVWPYISDIQLPARFSDEFQGAEWLSDTPEVGATFLGRNQNENLGDWEVTCHVAGYEENRVFAWNAGDAEDPSAQWRFELEPVGEKTRLRFHMVIGPGLSATGRAMQEDPDQAPVVLANRREQHRANMDLTLQGIKRLAETGS